MVKWQSYSLVGTLVTSIHIFTIVIEAVQSLPQGPRSDFIPGQSIILCSRRHEYAVGPSGKKGVRLWQPQRWRHSSVWSSPELDSSDLNSGHLSISSIRSASSWPERSCSLSHFEISIFLRDGGRLTTSDKLPHSNIFRD